MNEYRYCIKKLVKTDNNVLHLELGDIRGLPVFDFQPGQYVMIYYKNKQGKVQQKHTFSIASSPAEKKSLQLGIKIIGPFTTGLSKMQEGDEIFVSGPFGKFVFEEEKHPDLVLIAGGIGVTPFISTLRYATLNKLSNKFTLLYSNRTLSTTLFMEELLDLKKKNQNLNVLFSITEEQLPYEISGVVNKRLDAEIIQKFIGHTYGKTFFICGPKNFMLVMKKNLLSIGVHKSQIEMEGFSMIPDEGFWPKVRNTSYSLAFASLVFFVPFYFIHKIGSKSSAVVDSAGTVQNIETQAIPIPSNTATTNNSPTQKIAPVPNKVPIPVAAPAPKTKVS